MENKKPKHNLNPTKMVESALRYYLPHQKKALSSENLEENINFSLNIKNGKELIESKYPNIGIEVRIAGCEFYDLYYVTRIKGEKKEGMYEVLSDFIKICGPPQEVAGHCNDLVNKILQEYGKKIKDGFLSRIFFRNEFFPIRTVKNK